MEKNKLFKTRALLVFNLFLVLFFLSWSNNIHAYPSLSSNEGTFFLVMPDGSLLAWGGNGGQFGNGTTEHSSIPVQIGTEKNWKMIAVGGRHTVGLKKDGTLWTWGNNSNGQLGNGTTIDSLVPIQVGTNTDWAFVSAGGAHTTAIKEDGSLWSWGSSYQFIITSPDITPSMVAIGVGASPVVTEGQNILSPVQIGTDRDWKSVSSFGGYNLALNFGGYNLAIKRDGTLWEWGNFDNFERISQYIAAVYGGYYPVDNTERTYNIPVAITEERMLYFINRFNYDDWLFVETGYRLYDINNLRSSDDRHALLSDFPNLANEKLYILRANIPVYIKEEIEEIFANAGYTYEDYLADFARWTPPSPPPPLTYNSIPINIPVQIGRDRNWATVFAGYNNTAIKEDGTLWTWRHSSDFNYETRTLEVKRNNPVQVGRDRDWIHLNGNTAVKRDGSLWCTLVGDNQEPIQMGMDTDWITCVFTSRMMNIYAVKNDYSIWRGRIYTFYGLDFYFEDIFPLDYD